MAASWPKRRGAMLPDLRVLFTSGYTRSALDGKGGSTRACSFWGSRIDWWNWRETCARRWRPECRPCAVA